MDEDLPLLGEALAIELANTWYGSGEEFVDFLADPATARRWVALAVGAQDGGDVVTLQALRSSVRTLLTSRCNHEPFDPRAVEVVNAHAAQACAHVALIVEEGCPPSSRVSFRGDTAARIATSCVEVLTGPKPIRRCEGAGCTMFFVQQHGRRRFCHDGCSHVLRQARYRRNNR